MTTATITTMTLEERVAALEATVAEMRKDLLPVGKPGWRDRIAGSITDEEGFAEVLRLGREMRQADSEPEPLENVS